MGEEPHSSSSKRVIGAKFEGLKISGVLLKEQKDHRFKPFELVIEHVLRLGLRYRIMLTGSGNETPHRKWREIDLQPCCWLQLALPG